MFPEIPPTEIRNCLVNIKKINNILSQSFHLLFIPLEKYTYQIYSCLKSPYILLRSTEN